MSFFKKILGQSIFQLFSYQDVKMIHLYHEIVSPSNIRTYTQKVSWIWLPKHELNKKDTNENAKLGGKSPWGLNPTQGTKGKESRKVGPPQGRAPGCLALKKKNTSDFIWIQQVIFRNIYLGIHMSIQMHICIQWQLMKRGCEFEGECGRKIVKGEI